MYGSKTAKKKSLAAAAAKFAFYASVACASMGISTFASAWSVSPGGSTAFSAPVTLSINGTAFSTSGVNCTLTMLGSFAPSTGDLTITSAALNSNCQYTNGSATEGVKVDSTQFPIGPMHLNWTTEVTITENFNFKFTFYQKVGFSPTPAPVTCTFYSNLAWNNTSNISSSPPSNQATPGGYGEAYDALGNYHDCSLSGTFTISPSQTINY
ncbi:MAG: hypothetical protein J0I77_00500 [Rudaea sp.]|uniref:hypothetical protein n=1 Tax=unclassified Rudaea TaxID=2627037 RepID=UPI0010F6C038|nr:MULTISPECIES: hypothetical protein [unclassified Rudaea]MBN8884172.1 hypothetical protein [Rudaea sp.]